MNKNSVKVTANIRTFKIMSRPQIVLGTDSLLPNPRADVGHKEETQEAAS